MFPIWIIILSIGVAYIYYKYVYKILSNRIEKMYPGPKPLPFFGNGLMFTQNSEGIYKTIMQLSREHKRSFRIWLMNKPFIVLYDHRDIEPILSSNVHIDKSDVYQFTLPWIGYGLLTSTGSRWKSHRRIITPTFHFKILEDFVDIFNTNGSILCDRLEENSGKGSFDVYKYIGLAALDNICETAMGIQINAQRNTESKYVRAIKDICHTVNMRSFKGWLASDFVFNLTNYGKIQKEALKIIHGTTYNVIKNRRKEQDEKRKARKTESEADDLNQKRRLAFLDLLLESGEGSLLSDHDIREEVDTFMFEGHDTVTSGISYTLYALSQHPEIQKRCYEEQLQIFGDSDRPPTHRDIQDMKYLEQVVKEAQRVYPSVPMIGREMNEDFALSDGYILPKGSQITLLISALHKNPDVWPDPEKFDPENFSTEASQKRNPYSYVPFSAGPRNCIGQRFAMMEMKATVSKVVRRFELLPCEPEEKPRLVAELVLISANGINLKLQKRR